MRKHRGASQATTRQEREMDSLPGRAARIIEDEVLLEEVLRRACFIKPERVRAALDEAQVRIGTAREGGYVERFGKNPS